MPNRTYDVVVVGAGPAGSTAAIVLARSGARVALVDKATFPRDKACGDLLGPRGVAVLDDLGLEPPSGRRVGEMVVIGPAGRRVVLPARSGRTYPGHGLVLPRVSFDAWLREAAIAAGADPITGRFRAADHDSSGRLAGVVLDGGRRLDTDVVIGADGAPSAVGTAATLVDPRGVLWGFAQRAYADQEVDRPTIVLWDESPWRGFPGYGWLFPGLDGVANVGLGLGLGERRADASRAVDRFESFCAHLRALGVLTAPVDRRRLGGWLKLGIVGTTPARDRTVLVGDAAGLVNPLQGEGIAAAMTSGRAAAQAVLADPGSAAARYRRFVDETFGTYASVAAPLHAAAISGSPRRVSTIGRALTLPGLGRAIAAPWALYWNDLRDGAPSSITTAVATAAHQMGRLVTARSTIRRRLRRDLGE